MDTSTVIITAILALIVTQAQAGSLNAGYVDDGDMKGKRFFIPISNLY